jgi:hypothetical protein
MSQEDHYRPLNVKELIEILKEFPQELPVFAQGCDCTEEACWVNLVDGGEKGFVEICRSGTQL